MPGRTVGLDIGTHAVRIAEVSFGRGRPTLHRFAQVALPQGAVVAGEVMDPPAVAAALRRLWREAGVRSRTVITGVANQRVVARVTEVPSMPEAELRSALQFQVQDLIPIPVEEAVLDFQVIERVVGPAGQETLRILLVAAHRDMIQSLLAALEGAGLQAGRIDLIPLALIRAIHVEGFELPEEGEAEPLAEAIVGIGAGITNIVVHQEGRPRFIRSLVTGGAGITESIAAELGVEPERAEDLKRRAEPTSADPEEVRAAQVVAGSLTPLLEDLRGSLEFYLSQTDAVRLSRVVLTGGGSRVPELAPRLEAMLGVAVEPGQPLRQVQVGDTGLPNIVVNGSSDLLTVPLGLALSGEALDGGIRRVTLLPGEIGIRRAERRQIAMAGGGVAAFAALLLAVFLARNGKVASARDDADRAESQAAALQAKATSLSDVQGLQNDVDARKAKVTATLANDIAWVRLLTDISAVLPNDVWLTSFNGTSGSTGAAQVTFNGKGLDQSSAGRWLLRIGELQSLTGLWLPSSTSDVGSGQKVITFTSNATLTPAARGDRKATYVEGTP